MTNPTPEQVEAALKYGKGDWLYDDLKPLGRAGHTFDDLPNYAARILAAEVERLLTRAEKAEAERDEMRRRWHKSRKSCRQQGKGMQVQARINTLQNARSLLHYQQKQELYEEVRKLKAELKETLARAEKAEAERDSYLGGYASCLKHPRENEGLI